MNLGKLNSLLLHLLPPLAAWLMRLWFASCRVTVHNAEHCFQPHEVGKQGIAAFWHYSILYILYHMRHYTATAMVSASRDGEYIARLACVRRPLRYARSFFGVIDLLAILPSYLALLVPGLGALVDVRILRLLRIFRVLKLVEYVHEFVALKQALLAARRKILVFLSFVMLVVLVMGTLMYVVEGPVNGFTSIPVGVYWAITTMTTVGFGDVVPQTDLGRVIASLMMLLGWGTLAVPTGIVGAEFTAQHLRREPTTRTCHECLSEGHLPSAKFCRDCGAKLPPYQRDTDDTR